MLSTLTFLVFTLGWGDTALVAQQERDADTPAAQQMERPDTTNQLQTSEMPALLVTALTWGHAALVAKRERDACAPASPQQMLPIMDQKLNTGLCRLLDVATFSAKIIKSGDRLVLQDSIGESTYELDDQETAKAFAGKNVKVTGTVDVATNTAYVARIEPEL